MSPDPHRGKSDREAFDVPTLLRAENAKLVDAIREAYSALTRENDFGPDTTEGAVEAARTILGQEMVRTHAV